MALNTELPPLPADASWTDGFDGVLLNGWDVGWERRRRARSRLQKLRAKERKRARWEDPAPTPEPAEDSLLAMLPPWIRRAWAANQDTAGVPETPQPPKKARKPQASPKRDAVRAALITHPDWSVDRPET